MITYTNLRFTEIIIIILFLTLSNILFGQQPEYRVVQIPVYLTEGSLNDNAVVAGYTSSYQVCIWEDGVISYLPTIGGPINKAHDINNNSVVAGYVTDTDEYYFACSWHNGSLNIFNNPPGTNYEAFSASSINSNGTCIGNAADTVSWNWYPFIYNGNMIVLNQFEDYSFHAINDNNYIAGTYWWNNNQEWYAYSYYNGSVTFLSDPTSKTNAYAINNSNHILYYSETQGLILWKEGNHIPVGLHRPYELNGLNDQDIVVGHIITGGSNIAAIWDNGSIRCLDSLINPNLGIHLITAYDINNKGEILCLGSDNFCYFLSPASKITKPEEHEIWISGEQDTIKWEILGSPSNIRIDYSTDGGQTYDTISVSYPSDSCK